MIATTIITIYHYYYYFTTIITTIALTIVTIALYYYYYTPARERAYLKVAALSHKLISLKLNLNCIEKHVWRRVCFVVCAQIS